MRWKEAHSQKQYGNRQTRPRLRTIPLQIRIHRSPTPPRDIPRRPLLRMFRITHIARRLRMRADRKQRHQDGMHNHAQQRVPHMADPHYALDKQDEYRQDGDHDVEVRDELRPDQRVGDRVVVGVGVDDLVGVAVPAVVGAFLPEFCAVEVRLGDAVEGEGGD